jgi:NADPH-dependent 2,4-dienoyl-CoA reductase/sulfur reductase-like enzyme
MKRIVVIGGVAGGMSAATRLRRLDADAEIIVLEKKRICFVRQLRTSLLRGWRH